MTSTALVITTGDASDADGFLSLAMYAQMGVDVTYIMTLPACYDPNLQATAAPDVAPADANAPGLGYSYKREDPGKLVELCKKIVGTILKAENGVLNNTLNFLCKDSAGNLFYNEINGFSDRFLLHEDKVYGDLALVDTVKETVPAIALATSGYDRVYMDMNGSVPFMNGDDELRDLMDAVVENANFKGLYVMGGVDTVNPTPFTLILPFLNRFPLSTMNQFYAPKATKALFDVVHTHQKALYFVTNDEVNANGFFSDAEKMTALYSKFEAPTVNIAEAYYNYKFGLTGNSGAQKMFDLMTSAAIMHAERDAKDAMYDTDKNGGGLTDPAGTSVVLFNKLPEDPWAVDTDKDGETPTKWDHWKPTAIVPADYVFDETYGTTIVLRRSDNGAETDLLTYLNAQTKTATAKVNAETKESKGDKHSPWVEAICRAYLTYLCGLKGVECVDNAQLGGGRQPNAVAMASLALTTLAMAVFGSML